MLLHGPCEPWVTWGDVCCPNVVLPPGEDGSRFVTMASYILWALSGKKYSGTCSEILPICVPCGCHEECCCGHGDRFDLRDYWPVTRIIEVIGDDGLYDPGEYQLEGNRYVALLDGARWPRCTSLSEPGLRVEFEYGLVPPEAGKYAAGALACELAKACYAIEACRLPRRATKVTSQGTTYAIPDPSVFLDQGRTGIFEVDLWLEAERRSLLTAPGMFDPLREYPQPLG